MTNSIGKLSEVIRFNGAPARPRCLGSCCRANITHSQGCKCGSPLQS